MRTLIASRNYRLWMIIALTLALAASGNLVHAQEAGSEAAYSAVAAPPTVQEPLWTAAPLPLTAEQRARLEYWTDHTHLPGPALAAALAPLSAGPEAGSESASRDLTTAPGDATLFRGIRPIRAETIANILHA